jgi:alanine-glyoxylate transaminase/serine-glyoxylate transaminase/serine-pyruvate transaminase
MEACISNLIEPGDKVVVGNAGIWGERVVEMSKRFRGVPEHLSKTSVQ